jgi:serine/threonine-protein kinase
MSKKYPFLIELVMGVLLTVLMAWSYYKHSPFIETINLKTYDTFLKLSPTPTNTDTIQIVEIDETSVANLGRWPWPRSLVAQLVDEILAGGAKVIGLNIFYTEEEKNQGLEEIAQLQKKFSDLLKKQKAVFAKKNIKIADFEEFLDVDLEESQRALDGDSILAQSVEQAANIVLPMYFQPGDALGNNLEAPPAFFDKEKVNFSGEGLNFVPAGNAFVLPLENFGTTALAIGHSNLPPDVDGSLRRIAPVMRYGTVYFPSFGLQIVREYLKLERKELKWDEKEGFALGKAKIPVDENGTAFLKFFGPSGTFKHYSALDVLSGGVPENSLNNKIVLVGVTAPGLVPSFVGPGGQSYNGLEVWANHMENIMSQQFIKRPSWASKLEWGFLAISALIVIFALSLLKARVSIPLAFIAFIGSVGTSWFLFTKQGFWVSPAYGATLLLSGFAVIVGKRLLFTEKGKELVEAEGVETNKMLGLSFQGQGMLDLAFEKFRRCPVDDAMKELLYNLGLDMERKRQFSKAAAVYEHISTVDIGYKDIKDKIDLLKKAGEGAVFGGIGKKGMDSTVVVQGLGQNTTLGRYEITKELGRGAMGIVYLGKDPKINRQVAIKTLRFEEAMDEEQTKSVKERFFREAESAGNLTHPNIIRIFDAGEDQEVAYIAMELLEGEDLKKYSEKENLLPFEQVIDLVIKVADGLDYAHKQGVVHRDIKPGNIMLLKDGTLRITDFGIARIQATSKTATGAVLGTPAYMSPEQVNGKKADGRADIFSLGVMLYEMITGQKPFYADSIAALLYRIANVPHPDPREFNKKIPPGIIPIIGKALAKEAEERYQTAGEMADALRNFLSQWKINPNAGAEANEPAERVSPPAPTPIQVTAAPVPPPTNLPVNDNGKKEESGNSFLSELEEAFKEIKTSEDVPQETNPEKTVVMNPKPDSEGDENKGSQI